MLSTSWQTKRMIVFLIVFTWLKVIERMFITYFDKEDVEAPLCWHKVQNDFSICQQINRGRTFLPCFLYRTIHYINNIPVIVWLWILCCFSSQYQLGNNESIRILIYNIFEEEGGQLKLNFDISPHMFIIRVFCFYFLQISLKVQTINFFSN